MCAPLAHLAPHRQAWLRFHIRIPICCAKFKIQMIFSVQPPELGLNYTEINNILMMPYLNQYPIFSDATSSIKFLDHCDRLVVLFWSSLPYQERVSRIEPKHTVPTYLYVGPAIIRGERERAPCKKSCATSSLSRGIVLNANTASE